LVPNTHSSKPPVCEFKVPAFGELNPSGYGFGADEVERPSTSRQPAELIENDPDRSLM
jgi:hypothetical protein